MLTLYDYPLSGNCYKVRLLMSILGIPHKRVAVDFFPGREHKRPEFLAVNPAGTLPVLTDDNLVLTDSAAMLVYLAQEFAPRSSWFPTTSAVQTADCVAWLTHGESIGRSAGMARLHDILNYEVDVDSARAEAHSQFRQLDAHLTRREFEDCGWLLGPDPSIADIACFPYTALAGDGGISTDDYLAIGRWMRRIKELSGFIAMPGIHPLLGDKPS